MFSLFHNDIDWLVDFYSLDQTSHQVPLFLIIVDFSFAHSSFEFNSIIFIYVNKQ